MYVSMSRAQNKFIIDSIMVYWLKTRGFWTNSLGLLSLPVTSYLLHKN